jgi:putative transposase
MKIMAGNYSQVYIHILIVVKHKQHLISAENCEALFSSISGALRNKNNNPVLVCGTSDHMHLLVGINPDNSISDLVREIKSNTASFMNRQKLVKGRFCWQTGFVVVSYGQSQLDAVINYLHNQEEFHKKKSCREEFIDFLQKFKIVYDEKSLIPFPEDEN